VTRSVLLVRFAVPADIKESDSRGFLSNKEKTAADRAG
jgi:hypothetical protein